MGNATREAKPVVAGASAEIFSAAPGEDDLHPRAITIARPLAVEANNRATEQFLSSWRFFLAASGDTR
jgi:hypothetical protein